jgi:hypothetical protein
MRIRINSIIANVNISRFIDRAEELQETLRHFGGKTYEEFQSVHLGYQQWSADVQSRLPTMFDGGDVLITKWQAFQIGCIDEDESRRHNLPRLASSANAGIEWLKELQSHLTGIPQSPRTPQATVRPM